MNPQIIINHANTTHKLFVTTGKRFNDWLFVWAASKSGKTTIPYTYALMFGDTDMVEQESKSIGILFKQPRVLMIAVTKVFTNKENGIEKVILYPSSRDKPLQAGSSVYVLSNEFFLGINSDIISVPYVSLKLHEKILWDISEPFKINIKEPQA